MLDDVVMLSRIQFALTVMFHYIFPPLSIGLGTLMVFMEGTYLRTGDKQYHAMTRFWSRIFAVNFAMGVATGIVMEFQFGTNWANYSRYVGDIFGSALAAEGIFAFFLESGFLAVLVFGWDRVSPRMHFISTVMVSLGSIFSAVWIVVANSWQQTPAGYTIRNGRAEVTDFWAVVFNPSSMTRLAHVLTGSFILGAFFVMSISAWYILRGRHLDFAKKSFTIALVMGAIASLAAGATGHISGQKVAEHQPAKLAAFEAHFKSEEGGTGLLLFGVPDPENEKVDYAVYLPGGLSFMVHDNFTEPVPGLDQIPKEDRPPIWIPFLCFHGMVAMGTTFVLLTLLALFFRWRGTLFEKRWLMWIFVVAVGATYVCNQLGWIAAEVGRQPFIVYPELEKKDGKFVPSENKAGLRTSDGISKSVEADQVLGSILMFGFIYSLLFVVWVYVLSTKIIHGPDDPQEDHPPESSNLREATTALAARGGHSLTHAEKEKGA